MGPVWAGRVANNDAQPSARKSEQRIFQPCSYGVSLSLPRSTDGGCCGVCSDQDGESGERHAPPLRRTFKQGRDTAGEAGRHSAGYLEAGSKAQLVLYTFHRILTAHS